MSSLEVTPMTMELLRTITKHFSKKKLIGIGSYGEVYKGVLNGDEVAVKKLFHVDGLDDTAFDYEFRHLMTVQHKNIVRLIGYCYGTAHMQTENNGKITSSEVTERVLCLEYMQRGNLSQHISYESCVHDWPTTYKIIKGICEGLHYLHKGRGEKKHIYHLDLTIYNILLDQNMVPKISDFGLSRLFGETMTHEGGTARETVDFMPPEYIKNFKITPKNDVFSLGVIIFLVLAGEKGYNDYYDLRLRQEYTAKDRRDFIERVQNYWKEKMQATMGYGWDETDLLEVTTCIEIAMKCVEYDRDNRPTTTEIINDLKTLDAHIMEMSGQMQSNPNHMSLQHLKDITNNFSEHRILGRGGFGVVYKGVLDNGEMVAVKKLLQAMPSSEQQFENEVNLLMKLKHPNVVRLVGYCYETKRLHTPHEGKSVFAWSTDSLLCLECLPNGSLDKYISDASSGLNWRTRCKIIEGISSGLQYLHEQSDDPIIHVDLKPANILLDENMTPKITDFGLSRLFDKKQTIRTTIASGTRGYMPPDHDRGKITPMWDIFSFGVIVLEVITGHRGYPYPHEMEKSAKGFIECELQKWRNILQKDQGYTSLETDCQQIERCIQIGLICVNPERTERPTMKKIVDMLQGLESMNCYISNEVASHVDMN